MATVTKKTATTGSKRTTRRKPVVKVLSGSKVNDLEFLCPDDYILTQDVTDIDVARVVVPKGHILIFFPNSNLNAILTANSYPEGEHTIRVRAYALPRRIVRISKDMIIGHGILVKKI